jgi:fumarylpyruvate hydrolase
MGFDVDREAPFYFTKPANAITRSGMTVPYPPGTGNFHHEIELVVAIGRPAFRIGVDAAQSAVFGYATGLDMTRRDLQFEAREKGRPWDLAKAFEHSAVIAEIARAEELPEIGPQRIELRINGDIRQDARLSDLVWKIPEIISHLSGFYHLAPGDLIYTGTPAGVGPVLAGDSLHGEIDGLAPVTLSIGAAE